MGMLSFGDPCAEVDGDPPVLSRAPGAERGRTRWAAHPARGCQDLRERLVTLASPCREAWGVSCDTHSPAGSGCGSGVVKGLTFLFFTPIPFCPLGH